MAGNHGYSSDDHGNSNDDEEEEGNDVFYLAATQGDEEEEGGTSCSYVQLPPDLPTWDLLHAHLVRLRELVHRQRLHHLHPSPSQCVGTVGATSSEKMVVATGDETVTLPTGQLASSDTGSPRRLTNTDGKSSKKELSRTYVELSKELSSILREIAVTANDSVGFQDNRFESLQLFLEQVCGEEERKHFVEQLFPAIVDSALAIQEHKPFIGLKQFDPGRTRLINMSPSFCSSLLALAFLSALPGQGVNLNLHSLNLEEESSLCKIRGFLGYFHNNLQGPWNRKISFSKEIVGSADYQTLQQLLKNQSKLVPLSVVDSKDDICCHVIHTQEEWSRGILDSRDILSLSVWLHQPEFLLASLLNPAYLHSGESLRINCTCRNNSCISNNNCSKNNSCQISLIVDYQPHCAVIGKEDLEVMLNNYIAGVRPPEARPEESRSILRKPSVAAVTSADTEPSVESPPSPASSLSLSDSCMEAGQGGSESGKSYRLSDKEVLPAKRPNKIKKRESFAERLKASLARGETPDMESDDQSQPRLMNPQRRLAHTRTNHRRRGGRRQRSSGFRVFTTTANTIEESDDFFTATDDDQSVSGGWGNPTKRHFAAVSTAAAPIQVPEAIPEAVEVLEAGAGSKQLKGDEIDEEIRGGGEGEDGGGPSRPMMAGRRRLVPEKSFDLSTSSARVTSSSRPDNSSPQTCSSSLFSDSCSISSADLGIPALADDCLEDLCDKLTGCLELTEGGLSYRNTQLRQSIRASHLTALSDTQLNTIADLELLPFLPPANLFQVSTCRIQLGSEQRQLLDLRSAFSCPDLNSLTEPPHPPTVSSPLPIPTSCPCTLPASCHPQPPVYCEVQRLDADSLNRQLLPVQVLLLWVATTISSSSSSSSSDNGLRQRLLYNTHGHPILHRLVDLAVLAGEREMTVAELISALLKGVEKEEENLNKEKGGVQTLGQDGECAGNGPTLLDNIIQCLKVSLD